MCSCKFCGREFSNSQGVKAHLRKCPTYQNAKRHRPGGSLLPDSGGPNAPSPAQGSLAQNLLTSNSECLARLTDQVTRQFAGPDEATRLRQQRETLLISLVSQLVNWYRPSHFSVTSEMAAIAKVAILDEFRPRPIEELSHAELISRGEIIRNKAFAPFLKAQQVELRQQQEKAQREHRRAQEDASAQAHRVKRRAVLIELGVAEAQTSASLHGIVGPAATLFAWETRARLETLLQGDETRQEGEEAIEAAIRGPLQEARKKAEQARLAKRERIMSQGIAAAVPLVTAMLPVVTAAAIKKFHEKFGAPPSPQPNTTTQQSDASQTSSPPTSRDTRILSPFSAQEASVDRPVHIEQDVCSSESTAPKHYENKGDKSEKPGSLAVGETIARVIGRK